MPIRFFLIPILILVGAVSAYAQPSGLATTDNGSQIYFSTSQVLRGSGEVMNPKIFRLDSNGLALVEQRAQDGVPNFTNFFQLTSADVSGDGTVQVINADRPCNGGSACVHFERWSWTISSSGEKSTGSGHARISRNGRYAVIWGTAGFPSNNLLTLLDRVGKAYSVLSNATYAGMQSGRAITADGGVLILRQGALSLWRGAREVRILTAEVPISAVIDDGATTLIYETADHRSRQLRLGGGSEVALNSDMFARDAQISADGQIVMFTAFSRYLPFGQQLFAQYADGTGFRQISADADGIVQATLAGTGWVAYASTGIGRVIGIDVRTGSNFEFLPASPSIQLARGGFAPGSAIRIFGKGFGGVPYIALQPLPLLFRDVQVLLDGTAMPIHVVSPTEVRIQLPWELTPPAAGTVRPARLIVQIGDSPFDAAVDVNLAAIDPRAEPVTPPGFAEEQIAIHEDYSSPVSSSNPAKAGEIVHIYITGLGAVNPPVATGFGAPLSPLSLVSPVSIQIGAFDAEVLQVRLQPGLLGYYMADVRIPTGLSGVQGLFIRETYGGAEYFNVLGVLYVQ